MKKTLLLFLLLAFTALTGYAQFTILNPGVTIHSIRDLKEADTNNILFATDNGILVYNGVSWQHFTTANGLSSLDIKAIEPVNDTFFYYSTGSKTVGSCDYVKASDTLLPTGISYDYISAIYYSGSTGQTLFGSDNGGVWLRNDTTLYSLLFDSSFKTTLGSVSDIGQFSGATDFYVIATTNQAVLYQFSSSSAILVNTSTTSIPSNNIFSHAIIKSISYDGTDKGLFIADFTGYPSTIGTKTINISNSPIPSDTVSAVAVVDSNLFIGTPLGLAARINGEWKIYNSSNSNLPSSNITKLAADAKNLWIGTGDGQICKIGLDAFTTNVASVSNDSNQIICYPNPNTGKLHIEMKQASNNRSNVTLYDMTGKKVLSQQLQADGNINASGLAAGQYILELTNNQQSGKTIITIVR